MLEIEESLPHPSDQLHLTISSPIQELEDKHLILQVMIDHTYIHTPFGYRTIGQYHSLADELGIVELAVVLCHLVL